MKYSQITSVALSLCASILAGCATSSIDAPGAEKLKAAEVSAEKNARSVNDLDRTFYRKDDNIHVTGKVFRISESKDLPLTFQKHITIAPQGLTSYVEVGQLIARVAGVPVQVAPDALESFKDLAAPGAVRKSEYSIEFAKMGTLKDVIDAYASRGQLDWKYESGIIKLYKFDTKTFTLNAIAGSEKFSSSMGTTVESTNEGSKSSSEIAASVTAEIPEIWDAILGTIDTLKTKEGKVAANRQTGTITVTDTSNAISTIQDYIDRENERLNTTIMYRVDIIEVTKRLGDDYGLSFSDLLYRGTDAGFSLSSGASGVSEAVSALAGTVIRPTSRYNGSQAVVRAISTEMDLVSHRTAFTSEVIGLVARVQEVREQGYLAERSVNALNSTSGVEITQRVETTTEGFAVSMVGMPSNTGGLILQTLVDLSNIEAIERRGNDENYIESPLRLVRNGKSRTLIQPGDTVIAALMEHSFKEKNKSGIGRAMNWLLGGSSVSSNNQNYTVVLVTPYYREG